MRRTVFLGAILLAGLTGFADAQHAQTPAAAAVTAVAAPVASFVMSAGTVTDGAV